jgi:hypothetical protein
MVLLPRLSQIDSSLSIRVRSTGAAFTIQVCATDYVYALKYRIFQTISTMIASS